MGALRCGRDDCKLAAIPFGMRVHVGSARGGVRIKAPVQRKPFHANAPCVKGLLLCVGEREEP